MRSKKKILHCCICGEVIHGIPYRFPGIEDKFCSNCFNVILENNIKRNPDSSTLYI